MEDVSPGHTQSLNDGSILWQPIRAVSATGTKCTFYNIGVEEDESYVAEGVIVHNCKHHSKAKGGKPVDKHIRGLAWVAVRWAKAVHPRVIMLENVEEFMDWGRLDENNRPDPRYKGETFKRFIRQLEKQGYHVEYSLLRACDYGAPTIRKRFFLIARCDGQPIRWPAPTHGDPDGLEVAAGMLKPWVPVADVLISLCPAPASSPPRRRSWSSTASAP